MAKVVARKWTENWGCAILFFFFIQMFAVTAGEKENNNAGDFVA